MTYLYDQSFSCSVNLFIGDCRGSETLKSFTSTVNRHLNVRLEYVLLAKDLC